MEMHQIRYFLALCAEKNFTRAAQRCAVSQPSLTNAINRLECELGGKLFHRGSRNSRLTALASALRPQFEMIEQCARRARAAAERLLAQKTAGAGDPIDVSRHAGQALGEMSQRRVLTIN